MILVGFDRVNNTYRVYDPEEKTVLLTREIRVDERQRFDNGNIVQFYTNLDEFIRPMDDNISDNNDRWEVNLDDVDGLSESDNPHENS